MIPVIMFTEILNDLERGKVPDLHLLGRRFDLAMTKKLGVIKLPPAFWMQDPKINPRSDHLLLAALLLGDRERWDLALSALAVEIAEKNPDQSLDAAAGKIINTLLETVPAQQRQGLCSLAEKVGCRVENRQAETPDP